MNVGKLRHKRIRSREWDTYALPSLNLTNIKRKLLCENQTSRVGVHSNIKDEGSAKYLKKDRKTTESMDSSQSSLLKTEVNAALNGRSPGHSLQVTKPRVVQITLYSIHPLEVLAKRKEPNR
ncbi:hypothetical protein AMTR_s00157p00064400 [Amborella trichopoda]|uniref:Uncharacterized protein n=1 Tax=Amborella trichopoda TaxID=13333 RepID=W1PIR0_AMBTC|nr:hypothetical protein AMTR_s00157p00064400 [Amborella trichopoda]